MEPRSDGRGRSGARRRGRRLRHPVRPHRDRRPRHRRRPGGLRRVHRRGEPRLEPRLRRRPRRRVDVRAVRRRAARHRHQRRPERRRRRLQRVRGHEREALIMKTLLTLLMCAVVASGCDSADSAAPTTQGTAGPKSYPYTVVTTVGMVTDIVQQVAGDKGKVTGLIGSGVDPHLYKPTRNDVAALLEADVVFYSGLMLEGKMADTFVKIATSGKPVFAVTEKIDESFLLSPPDFAGHHDPHVWMDPKGWMKAVEVVAESLSQYDAANASLYKQNADSYLAELRKLDEYATKSLGSIPEKQ